MLRDPPRSPGFPPAAPFRSSATSHWPAEGRHVVVEARNTSTHELLVPEQWSAPSQAPPFEAPVQLVVSEANPSSGHAPEVPVQDSATSHWPAEGRHVVVEAR